jgi:endonuclease V-like protein UPF0215 family
MSEEPFDFLFPGPGPVEVHASLPLSLLRDIRSALEQSIENYHELISVISHLPEERALRPSERREIDHHSAGAAKAQHLVDELVGHFPELMREKSHA